MLPEKPFREFGGRGFGPVPRSFVDGDDEQVEHLKCTLSQRGGGSICRDPGASRAVKCAVPQVSATLVRRHPVIVVGEGVVGPLPQVWFWSIGSLRGALNTAR